MPDIRGTSQHNQNALLAPVIDPLASAPSSPIEGQQWYDTVNHVMKYWNGTSWIAMDGSTPGTSSEQYILLQDQKTSGTDGQSLSGNTWNQRNLNTIVHDDTGAVVVSSNNFTLPAGTYKVSAQSSAACNNVAYPKLRLYNATDSTTILYGIASNGSSNPSSGEEETRPCFLSGVFTISSSKTFRLDQWLGTSAQSGGRAMGISGVPEIYTEVELRKVA